MARRVGSGRDQLQRGVAEGIGQIRTQTVEFDKAGPGLTELALPGELALGELARGGDGLELQFLVADAAV